MGEREKEELMFMHYYWKYCFKKDEGGNFPIKWTLNYRINWWIANMTLLYFECHSSH